MKRTSPEASSPSFMKTAVATLSAVLLIGSVAYRTTDGFEVLTEEGARRLSILRSPMQAPDVRLRTQTGSLLNLVAFLSKPHTVTIVDFVYTRCATVCSTSGSDFTRLQRQLAKSLDSSVQLLSISFDPRQDDEPALRAFAQRWQADPAIWTIGTIDDPHRLKQLLEDFKVIVIADGRGGFDHNAALLIVDARSRLVRIFDVSESATALGYARLLKERS